MPPILRRRLREHIRRVHSGETTAEKGRALEDLVAFLFSCVPGIEIAMRNVLNAFDTEEVDVAFWNNQLPNGFPFLPNVFLVECKNWSAPVGSAEVIAFVAKLRHRGSRFGILVATNGITGNADDLRTANFEIATALAEGYSLIVLTSNDIDGLTTTGELIRLLKTKICELVVCGTVFSTPNTRADNDPAH